VFFQTEKMSISGEQLKLVVFGATGATGTELVKQGLELGHEITAIVRTPENFKLK
jgi:putative NADH-flavin reductase